MEVFSLILTTTMGTVVDGTEQPLSHLQSSKPLHSTVPWTGKKDWFENSHLMLVSVLQSDANTAFIYSDSTELWDKHSRGSLCSTSNQESLLQKIS